MLSKHREAFSHLKDLLGPQEEEEDFLLENFFYSITPVIQKNLLDLRVLQKWYLYILALLKEPLYDKLQEREEEGVLYICLISTKKEPLSSLYKYLIDSNLHSTRMAAVLIKQAGKHCLSALLRFSHPEEKEQWREGIVHHLGN